MGRALPLGDFHGVGMFASLLLHYIGAKYRLNQGYALFLQGANGHLPVLFKKQAL